MKTKRKINSNLGETLAKWYLRFNGYFIIDNFIVHAGDDVNKIKNGVVANHTETDILAIRHKFSKEITGILHIQNDIKIINTEETNIDFIIVEVKTGKKNKPNTLWTEKKIAVIEYILRIAGFIEAENLISSIANELAEKGNYQDAGKRYSVRLALISEVKANNNWKHIKNVLFDDIINFIVDVRGQCWKENGLGVSSIHYQWDDLINEIFKIANDTSLTGDVKKTTILSLLQKNETTL